MYKRIAGAMDQATIDDVRSELHDRYGAPPESVLNLLSAGELRLQCERLGIAQLDRKRTQVELPNPNGNKKQPLKAFVEMLHIRFAVPEANALGAGSLAHVAVDPGVLMKLVARNAKRGAQFTPQGIFRWPLTSSKAEEVLAETRALLDSLDTGRP
jgi:transcription-repair coupling factor (superfamily II helicase)